MIDINYELEFNYIHRKRIYEKPKFATLFFKYKQYDFIICAYYDELFSDNLNLCATEVRVNGKSIYTTGEFNCSEECGKIKNEKIIKKPIYRNVILNLYKNIENYIKINNIYCNSFNDEIQYLDDETFNKIMDIWQLIIKNIFSERKE